MIVLTNSEKIKLVSEMLRLAKTYDQNNSHSFLCKCYSFACYNINIQTIGYLEDCMLRRIPELKKHIPEKRNTPSTWFPSSDNLTRIRILQSVLTELKNKKS